MKKQKFGEDLCQLSPSPDPEPQPGSPVSVKKPAVTPKYQWLRREATRPFLTKLLENALCGAGRAARETWS